MEVEPTQLNGIEIYNNKEGFLYSEGEPMTKLTDLLIRILDIKNDDLLLTISSKHPTEILFEICNFYKINIFIYGSSGSLIWDSKERHYKEARGILDHYIHDKLNKDVKDIIIYDNDGLYYSAIVKPRETSMMNIGFSNTSQEDLSMKASETGASETGTSETGTSETGTSETGASETGTSKMDTTENVIYPPPKKPTKEENVNPHAFKEITYEFFTTDSLSYDKDTGEVETVTRNKETGEVKNIESIFADAGNPDSGKFKIKSGSVSDITLSIVSVIEKIFEKKTKNPKTSAFETNFTKNIETLKKYSGRDNVEPVYAQMYEKFIIPLTQRSKDSDEKGYMMDAAHIKSYFVGPSAIKAILDSGPLGETVLNAIDDHLVPCFDDLSIEKKDIDEYLEIWTPLKKNKEYTSDIQIQADIVKAISFWVELEYCRVFQLVSSDIVGAVNGLIPLRAIIENTGFTGFINIPRGSGGQIGLDNKVCIYSLFLYNVFTRTSNNFFNIDIDVYTTKFTEFSELIKTSKEFVLTFGIQNNFEQIQISLEALMDLLKKNSDGVLKGKNADKKNKIIDVYNVYKIITIYTQFIKDNETFFKLVDNALQNSYDSDKLIVYNSHSISWLCFQLTRYQQTQKVYKNINYEIPDIVDSKDIIDKFNERRKEYCAYVVKNREIFQIAWYKALQKVYINEAFGGHDNNSAALTRIARDVFGSKGKYTSFEEAYSTIKKLPKEGEKKVKKKNRKDIPETVELDEEEKMEEAREEVQGEDTGERLELGVFLTEFIKNENGSYSENPEEVIKTVLKETNCTVFSDTVSIPTDKILWAVGGTAKTMVNSRDLDSDNKLPMNLTSVSLLDIITGEKKDENTINVVVDLAKYTPVPIMNIRSVEQVQSFIPSIETDTGPEVGEEYKVKEPLEEPVEEESSALASRKTNTEILLDNKILEQNVLKNFNVNTVYIPIISAIDAASFTKPTTSRYSTGTLKFPIDVGNGITMVVTFKAGINDKFQKNLCIFNEDENSKKDIFTEKEISSNIFARCIDYFIKKAKNEGRSVLKLICDDLNSKIQTPAEVKKQKGNYDVFSSVYTKPVNTNTYSTFCRELLSKIAEKKYNDYYLFLKVAIPKINSLKSSDKLFDGTASGLGELWKQLIINIAMGGDIFTGKAFIETIKNIPIFNKLGGKVTQCEEYIDKFIAFISNIQPKYPAISHSIEASLKQAINAEAATVCSAIKKNDQLQFSLLDMSKRDAAILEVGQKQGQSASLLISMLNAPLQAQTNTSFNDSPAATSEVIEALSRFKRPHEEGVEGESPLKQTKMDRESIVEKLIQINNKLAEIFNQLDFLYTLEERDEDDEQLILNAISQRDVMKKDIEIYERKLSKTNGGGQIGGDDETDYEEIYKLEAQLVELRTQVDEILIKMVTFTNGPISNLEISQAAVIFGPELFEQIAQAQKQEIIENYNKIFAMNVGNVPFSDNKEVATNPEDIVLPEGTTIEDFDNTIVMVKYIDGKYHIESADKFFQSFLDNYNTKTYIEGTFKDAAKNVEEVVETVKDYAESTIKNVDLLARNDDKKYTSNSTEVAEAAGGSNKTTRKKRNNIKKFTRRKRSNKVNKYTKRKKNKLAKKTKRKILIVK